MVENEVGCNWEDQTRRGFKHTLIHDNGPTFLSEDLKHGHEGLERERGREIIEETDRHVKDACEDGVYSSSI